MRFVGYGAALTWLFCGSVLAQEWEFGGAGGFGWVHDTSISNLGQSATAGLHPGIAAGVVFGENLYNYIGGEVRYLFRAGAPMINYQGTRADMSGYSNTVVYDLMFHMKPRDARFRPFVAAGAGIKVYTGTGDRFQLVGQPLLRFAALTPVTQVEPAISVGGGVKYLVRRHVLLRADFRTYMTPLPNCVFRTPPGSSIRGWVFDLVPQIGVSYMFGEH